MKRGPRVLAIDDEPAMTSWIKTVLEQHGYEVSTAEVGALGQERLKTWRPAAIVTDLVLPDVDGVEHIRKLKELDPDVAVIVLSGQGDVPRSVEAVKAGAFDFLEKPVDADRLLDKLEKGIKQKTLIDENEALKQKLQDRYKFQNIVGKSKKMQELFDLVESVAASEANILIQGENGTGKELIANAIHRHSKRADAPFVKVNCAAIPSELMESEIFGHKRGSFTGALADREGILAMADGGSLLLDEIGEMPAALQVKLLRVLQEREFTPVGGSRPFKSNFRLICATNIDLDAALADKKLRADLFFRINTFTLTIPPLRDRSTDIPVLAEHLLAKHASRHQRDVGGISTDAMQALMRHRWPGNVRELEHAIERAVIVAAGREIQASDLPSTVREPVPDETALEAIPQHCTLQEIERLAILRTLEQTRWNKRATADILGLYRPTLYSKLKKYNLLKRPMTTASA